MVLVPEHIEKGPLFSVFISWFLLFNSFVVWSVRSLAVASDFRLLFAQVTSGRCQDWASSDKKTLFDPVRVKMGVLVQFWWPFGGLVWLGCS